MAQPERTPREIAEHIADAGALIEAERKGVVYAATRALRDERNNVTRALTKAEAQAVLHAISQMTQGNNYDFHEWKLCTHATRAEWLALLRAEQKLQRIAKR